MRLLPILLFLTLALGYVYLNRAPDISIPPVHEIVPVATSSLPDERDLTATIGQHFMIGHWADSPIASTTELIQEYGVGGVIIMSAPEDPTEIRTWVETWQAVSPTPLLIAIDQEGGPVSRLKGSQFTPVGQNSITDTMTAYEVGHQRGQELRALGINLNFAPVLDIAKNPQSFMYSRVFPDRDQSPVLAAAMVQGMADAGVIAVVKHFPGHDDTSEDSHVTLPIVPYAGAELDNFLSPFHTLLTTEPPAAIMTAHVAFPSVDPLPATLSSYWLTTHLRNTIQFNGVIVTDDMIMDAIDTTWPHETASVLALQAGADLILYAAEPRKVEDAIISVRDALANEALSKDRMGDSLKRVELLQSRIK